MASPTDEGRGQAPLGIGHLSEQDLVELMGSEVGFLEGMVSVQGRPLVLQTFQRSFLNSRARYRWVTKSRQVGFSYVIALEALARCHLRKEYSAHLVSFSREEAKNKLDAARAAYDSLPLGVRRRLVTDAKTELAFASATGVSRIFVHPSKAPRGYNGDIYLDELAHYQNDRRVYTGSTALVIRGSQLTGCSTPLGKRGVFWEVAVQAQAQYPQYRRWQVPWWLCTTFCAEPALAIAAVRDGARTTELVERFGTADLAAQLQALGLEAFEQEFCCAFSNTSGAYFDAEEVLACTEDLDLVTDPLALPRARGRYVAGFDVGQTRDNSVLSIFDENEDTFRCVAHVVFEKMPLHLQEVELRRLLHAGLLSRLTIDATGLGAQLANSLADSHACVRATPTTAAAKDRWVTQVRTLLETRRIVLPRDRRLVADFEHQADPHGRREYDLRRRADRAWACRRLLVGGDGGRV